jgi:hypothetical protein
MKEKPINLISFFHLLRERINSFFVEATAQMCFFPDFANCLESTNQLRKRDLVGRMECEGEIQ